MIRFAWLQSRVQTLGAAAVLAAIAILAAITGVHLSHLYNSTVANCQTAGDCPTAVDTFLRHDEFLRNALPDLLLVMPALIGIFWGAPVMAREFETGTFRLAWTQGVSRTRWLATKLALGGLASVVVAGLLSLTVTWWFRAPDLLDTNRFDISTFGERGIVAMGYALFALALGVLAGLLIRRTLPAMVVTLVGYIGVRLGEALWLRQHFASPLHTSLPITASSGLGFTRDSSGHVSFIADHAGIHNAWVYSTHIVNSAGHQPAKSVLTNFVTQHCPGILPPPDIGHGGTGLRVKAGLPSAFNDCVHQLSSQFHLLVAYQPASRYWPFQWAELGVFVGLALVAVAASFWWLRHRIG